MQFRNAATGQRELKPRVGEGRMAVEWWRATLRLRQPWNLAFLQPCLIAMGHAREELIIKIKYSGERESRDSPLSLVGRYCRAGWRRRRRRRRSDAVEPPDAERGVRGNGGSSRALVSSPAGSNIHN